MAGDYRYQGVNRVDRVNRGPRRNLAFARMLRSWVEQYLRDLASEIPLGRREEGDDIYGDDDTVHLNLEIGDRVFFLELEPPSDHDPKRAKGVLRARNGRGDVIKGDVEESTFVRINHWIRCQV
jgi:hypothetical protein